MVAGIRGGLKGGTTAEKDIAQKKLEMYNDVFADIFNALVFGGRNVIKEDSLEDAATESFYRNGDEEGSRNQYRDVAKYWKEKGVRICLLGLENQSTAPKDMVIRVLSYDAAGYKDLLTKGKNKLIGPVVTLVLYFGMKPWDAPTSLHEYLGEIPEELKKYVSDYKINVIDIPRLPRKVIDSMTSDFYIIADHFWQLANNGDYTPDDRVIKHVWELLELMGVMNQDNRFVEKQIIEGLIAKGDNHMSQYLDRIISEGEARGEAKGALNTAIATVRNLMKNLKLSAQAAMDAAGISPADRPAILAAL